MKKNSFKGAAVSVVIALIAVLALLAGWAYFSGRSVSVDAPQILGRPEPGAPVPEAVGVGTGSETGVGLSGTPQPDESAAPRPGSYEAYGAEKISRAVRGQVVLFFRAGWCPTCRALDADIRAHLQEIPSNLTILDVDYDNSAPLKRKYGITYQHTFVQVDAQGNLLKKWSGSPTLTALVAEVK